MLQFARAPFATQLALRRWVIGDLRFDRVAALEMSEIELRPAAGAVPVRCAVGAAAGGAVDLEVMRVTPFEQIGGQPTIDRIIDSFYDRMETLPEARVIRALHPKDLAGTRAILKKYLAEWLGGPPGLFTGARSPRLRARHLPFSIGDEERDAWMFCMRGLAGRGCYGRGGAGVDSAEARAVGGLDAEPGGVTLRAAGDSPALSRRVAVYVLALSSSSPPRPRQLLHSRSPCRIDCM